MKMVKKSAVVLESQLLGLKQMGTSHFLTVKDTKILQGRTSSAVPTGATKDNTLLIGEIKQMCY